MSGSLDSDLFADPLAGKKPIKKKKKRTAGLTVELNSENTVPPTADALTSSPAIEPPMSVPLSADSGLHSEQEAFKKEMERRARERAEKKKQARPTGSDRPSTGVRREILEKQHNTMEIPSPRESPFTPSTVAPPSTFAVPSPAIPRMKLDEDGPASPVMSEVFLGGGVTPTRDMRSEQQINPEKQFRKKDQPSPHEQPSAPTTEPIPRRFAEGSKQLHPKNLFESPSPHEEEELFERDTSPNDSMPQSQESLRAQTSARGRSISTKSFTDLDDNKANNANLKKRNSIPSQYEENQSPTGPSPLTGSAGQFAVPTGRPSQSSKGLSGSSKRRQIQLPPASSTPPDSDTDHQTWKELRQNQRLLGEREKSLNEREEQLREREQAAEAREEQLLMVQEKLSQKTKRIREVRESLEEKHAELLEKEKILKEKSTAISDDSVKTTGDSSKKRLSQEASLEEASKNDPLPTTMEEALREIANHRRREKEFHEMLQAKCKIIQLRDDFIASEVAEKEKLIERVKELEKALH